ncbi:MULTISPECIES: hypothetical protein [Paenibacillus]|uniref:hypothetical protein n=1 Tax=Paenibacillus TaxID=44249 RepID=UPI00117E38DF|nr:hypothetical protein [Paenibacillus lautus]
MNKIKSYRRRKSSTHRSAVHHWKQRQLALKEEAIRSPSNSRCHIAIDLLAIHTTNEAGSCPVR